MSIVPTPETNLPQVLVKNGGDDETRSRDLCRDRAETTSTYNNLHKAVGDCQVLVKTQWLDRSRVGVRVGDLGKCLSVTVREITHTRFQIMS
jgi:hypothetical protein